MPVNDFDFEKAEGIIDNIQNMAVGRAPISAQKIFDYVSVMQRGFGIGSGTHFAIEEGVLNIDSDIARPLIEFNEDHNGESPFFVCLSDDTDAYDAADNIGYTFTYTDWSRIVGAPIYSSSSVKIYGSVLRMYRTTNPNSMSADLKTIQTPWDDTSNTQPTHSQYWVTPAGFTPGYPSDVIEYKISHSYKWMAIWFA